MMAIGIGCSSWRRVAFVAIALTFAWIATTSCLAQIVDPPIDGGNGNGDGGNLFIGRNNIGGVRIDADGVLSNPTIDQTKKLRNLRAKALAAAPGDLNRFADLRFVSLGKLSRQIAEHSQSGKHLPDAMQFLAGLQRVQYVIALPEENDIVLAGPAEGWKVDRLGNIVGITTGRPVLLLDDLVVALRTYGDLGNVATCSIDPTTDGLARLQAFVNQQATIGNPRSTIRKIEETLGPQTITFRGIDGSSNFARVMIAADFRMKRLAMKFEKPPIDSMPSYLDLIRAGRRGMNNMMPRWWLAPKYDAFRTDEEKLVWEIRGQGVECLTEEDIVDSNGRKTRTGKANSAAARWAKTMTERYSDLADRDSIFGQLRNLMDLAVVSAILGQEQLDERAGVDLSALASFDLQLRYNTPRSVATRASFVKKGRDWVISASGGVEISPWETVAKPEPLASDSAIRTTASSVHDHWWWE